MVGMDSDTFLPAIAAATDRFTASVAGLDAAALRGPSLLPGWTRGHVVAHAARNAHALANVLRTAAGGPPTPMYPSVEARNAAIEEGSTRSPDVLLREVTESAAAYADAARAVPDDRLDREVEWIGRFLPARLALGGRLREVEFHHVDLDAGYIPADWDADFVVRELGVAAEALAARPEAPAVLLVATDVEVPWRIAGAGPERAVTGPSRALLAWLAGRSAGHGLQADGGALPTLPGWP